jgi:hypothetical protein
MTYSTVRKEVFGLQDYLEEEKDFELTEDNVLPFTPKSEKLAVLAPATKDPNDPNWLYGLPKGTQFLVQSKHQTNDFALGEFTIINKREDIPAVLLHSDLNNEIMTWVDSRRFCRVWGLFTILQMGDQIEE